MGQEGLGNCSHRFLHHRLYSHLLVPTPALTLGSRGHRIDDRQSSRPYPATQCQRQRRPYSFLLFSISITRLDLIQSNDVCLLDSFVIAVCLDGSLPGYHFRKGFGSGSNSWLLHIEVFLLFVILCVFISRLFFNNRVITPQRAEDGAIR